MNNKRIFLVFILFSMIISILMIKSVPEEKNLRELASKNDLLIGTAVAISPFLKDKEYRDTLKKEFNVITLENDLKFVVVHPQRERYDFFHADLIVEFAEKNGQKVRGHTLVWDQQLPDWITNRHYSKEELKAILKDHIHTVVGQYKGRIYAWDVVNEAFNDDGSLKDNIWLNVIGPEYIELSFQWAYEADPNALLYINDYDNEGINAKSEAIYQTVKDFKEQGVPINGVGFQMHTSISRSLNYQEIYKNMKRLSDLGVQVQITELDVQIQDNQETLDKKLVKQAEIYSDTLKVCLQIKECSAFVMWGFTDKYTWIPLFTGKDDMPLIMNNRYEKKPAYQLLRDVLLNNHDK